MLFDTYIRFVGTSIDKQYYSFVKNTFNSATVSLGAWTYRLNPDLENTVRIIRRDFKTINGNSLINFPNTSLLVKEASSVEEFTKQYIQSTIRAFPEIQHWVLFNEIALESGQLRTKTTFSDGSKDVHPILEIPNWIHRCFIWALEANPSATFYINDYLPQSKLKWDIIFRTVDSLLDAGIPVGIGVQHHHHLFNKHLLSAVTDGLFLWKRSQTIAREAIKRGIPVAFTETSIWNNWETISGGLDVVAQALMYRQLAQCALDEGVRSFNIWSSTNHPDYHWKYRPDDKDAGLSDRNFNSNLICEYLIDLIRPELSV